MIKAECVAASYHKHKIATFKVTMPRYILAEFNTHRVFSRNSASSRAIPNHKIIKSIEDNPFIPIAWQKDHKGMQGNEYYEDHQSTQDCTDAWLFAKNEAVRVAIALNTGKYIAIGGAYTHDYNLNVTKQLTNRLLEPFMWHTVLVTATEWENFFNLRCPQYKLYDNIFKSKKDALKYHVGERRLATIETWTDLDWLKINQGQADIHMMAVAEAIYDAWNEAEFKELKPGEWHIPFGDQIDEEELNKIVTEYAGLTTSLTKIMISIARCARLSYQTLGDNPVINYKADIDLYNSLKRSGHWSPFEHVAKAMNNDEYIIANKTIINKEGFFEQQPGWIANYRGWIQQRAYLENAA